MLKRALLILVGGRQIPNLLSAQYLMPDVVVPITSRDAMGDNGAWSSIDHALRQICPDGVVDPRKEEQFKVDAFDLEEVRTACNAALDLHPDAEWISNVTCATTIMSIGAYEVGRQRNTSIWYFDTATRRVVTLSGNPPDQDLYHLKVADYMGAYGRRPKVVEKPPSQQQVNFARKLASVPADAMKFREALRKAKANEGKSDQPRNILLKAISATTQEFCELAKYAGMIERYDMTPENALYCELPNDRLWKFMEGLWLEVYAWVAAKDADCCDDYQYGLKIPMRDPNESSSNEIDLALTHAASLLIGECKSERKPFETEHLDHLRTVASMVGGNFVGCVFITGQLASRFPGDQYKEGSFARFCSQARARQIVVVPGEELVNLSAILRREAGADSEQRPTFMRGGQYPNAVSQVPA